MGKRGFKGRGRGGRGGHVSKHSTLDFEDDFALDFVESSRGGRGRGRGGLIQLASVFVPPSGRGGPRGGLRGAGLSAQTGRGSFTPRGRGNFQPRGRGESVYRGRGRGDSTPRGRGRGFGYADAGNGDREYRNRLLEPISFIRAEITPRVLFEEESKEEIFKAEVVDLEQGDSVPTADVIEAAFAEQSGDEQDDESRSSNEEYNPKDEAPVVESTIKSESYSTPASAASRQIPKLDIASAVSLATAFKDAVLTPREEHAQPLSPLQSKAIINEIRAATPSITTVTREVDTTSDSESEDVVLYIPQPRTPMRPLTPLPLLAAPGPAHSFGVAPSPMRPSPLASSFGPQIEESIEQPQAVTEKEEIIREALHEVPHEELEQRTVEMAIITETESLKISETTTVHREIAVPVINFDDMSSIMFVDTTPAPVEHVAPITTEARQERVLGIEPTKPAPSFHDMSFKFTSRAKAERTVTPPTTQETQEKATVLHLNEVPETTKPAAPNFHDMTFNFTPRTAEARMRKPVPGSARRGLGFRTTGKRVPREGDSDLDWGDEGPPTSRREIKKDQQSDEDSDEEHGMLEDVSPAAMSAFISGVEGREWVSMDDIADGEKLRLEDEEEGGESEESEDDSAEDVDVDEDEEFDRIIAEAERDLVDSDDDSDDDVDGSFRTRLARMRQRSMTGKAKGKSKGKGKGKGKARMEDSDESEMEMDVLTSGFTWAEEDEAFIAALQDQLDEQLFLKRERKRGGMISPPMSPASRGKNKHVPPELQSQWERDRTKKAENKRLRALQRQLAAQEAPKRGSGSKSKASFMFNNLATLPTLSALEPKLREFAEDLDSRTLALPAMDKESRRRVHLLAECFGIKTDSKGKGTGRYVTLIRTSRTGLTIDEVKVRKLVRAANEAEGGNIGAFNRAYYRRDNDGPGGSKGKVVVKTRDGEVVGRAAAKIGVENMGHKMLSKMGWSEGDKIGKSGGLADPLTAIMKNTKLGLGATRK